MAAEYYVDMTGIQALKAMYDFDGIFEQAGLKVIEVTSIEDPFVPGTHMEYYKIFDKHAPESYNGGQVVLTLSQTLIDPGAVPARYKIEIEDRRLV